MADTPFHDLDDFIALRRLSNLALSPDGERLVVAVQQLNPKRTAYVSALWEIDPAGERLATRLTRSAPGEAAPAFASDGSLLFTSKRPDAESSDEKPDDKPALWLLPERGEARVVAQRPGGVSGFVAARGTGTTVLAAPTLPGTEGAEADSEARKARQDLSVSALLHETGPVRLWDHDLGPDETRLFWTELPVSTGPAADDAEPRDLTPAPGRSLEEAAFDLSPDGRTLVTTWLRPEAGGDLRSELAVIDVISGDRRIIASDPDQDFVEPCISPDGSRVVCARHRRVTNTVEPAATLWLIDLETEQGTDLTPDLELWLGGARWAPDGRTIYLTADERGRKPVFAVSADPENPAGIRRLVSDAAYSDLQVSPDGRSLFALRAAVDAPPEPVRLDTALVDQSPILLNGPEPRPTMPGSVTEVFANASDGTPLRSWLVLPDGASAGSPAPLLLWVHGGPYASWNGWHWRWTPWVAAAHGYAVLLPDPALSLGYGQEFLRRGHDSWGEAPYTDLMTLTDACIERSDIDQTRTAAMGGSFGGYMANWIAGHTDRFDAIVTHASLWALDQFGPTTDMPAEWFRELSPEGTERNSPQRHADAISTPMLVIHGDRDYRVPVGEALRLWHDLVSRWTGAPEELPHRFLYFPDENHWVLKPQHVKIWYRTVLGFLGWHLLGQEWERPSHV